MKVRDWTLVFNHDEEYGYIRTRGNYSKQNRNEEHVDVIEHSAYARLLRANEVMKLALEFYASDIQVGYVPHIGPVTISGTHAIKALSEVKKIEGGES